MAVKNFYNILGVSEDASKDDIKKAYKSLAKEWHPDTKKDPKEKSKAEQKFKDINEAFAVLADEKKRSEYDYARKNPNAQFRANGGASGGISFEDLIRQHFGSDFFANDWFSDVFGRGQRQHGRQPQEQRNGNVVVEIHLKPQDSLKKIKKKVSYKIKVHCKSCDGKGGSNAQECATCHGAGRVQQHMQMGIGQVLVQEGVCPKCHGQGRSFKSPCNKCSARGYTLKDMSTEIAIEPGSAGRQVLRGLGHKQHDEKEPGDLIVELAYTHTNEFSIISRKGDIQTTVEIDPVMALVGGQCTVDGLDGKKISIKIPSNTKDGEQLVISNRGMLIAGNRGDLVATVSYKYHQHTLKQKGLLEEYLKCNVEG